MPRDVAQAVRSDLCSQLRDREVTEALSSLLAAPTELGKSPLDRSRRVLEIRRSWLRTALLPEYWRCLLSTGELAVPVQLAEAARLLEEGFSERAEVLLKLVGQFHASPWSAHWEALCLAAKYVATHVNQLLEQAIPLHDKGDFDGALAAYDLILDEYPYRARVHFERAYSMLGRRDAQADVRTTLETALECNPFYSSAISVLHASGRPEAIFKQEVNPFLRSHPPSNAELTAFAMGCMRLGDHWSAAHARVLMQFLGLQYPRFLLEISLTEMGLLDNHEEVAALLDDIRETQQQSVQSIESAMPATAISENRLAEALAVAQNHLESRDFHGALALAQDLYEAATHSNSHPYREQALQIEALCSIETGCDARAVDCCLAAISISDERGAEPETRAQLRLNFCEVLRRLGRFVEAKFIAREALDLANIGGSDISSSLATLAVFQLARTIADLGDPAYALLLLEEHSGNVPTDLAARLQLFECRSYIGRHIGGEFSVEQAQMVLNLTQQLHGAASPLAYAEENNLAWALQRMGRVSEARQLYALSLDHRVALFGSDSPEVATILNNLALLEQDVGNLPDAVKLMRTCVDLRRTLRASTSSLLDSIQSLAIMEFVGDDWRTAKALAAEALHILDDIQAPSVLEFADAHYLLKRRRIATGVIAACADNALTSSDRTTVLDALLAQKLLADAYLIESPAGDESSRVENLQLASSFSALALRGPNALRDQEYFHVLRVLADRLKLAAVHSQLPPVESRINTGHIVDALDTDEIFVDISCHERPMRNVGAGIGFQTFFVGTVVTKTGIVSQTNLGPCSQIDALVGDFYDEFDLLTVSTRDSASHLQPTQRVCSLLYSTLLKPLNVDWSRTSRVIFSLDGTLAGFPMSCLVCPDDRYLVEHVYISYLASHRTPNSPTHDRPHRTQIVVFGNVDYGSLDSARVNANRSSTISTPLWDSLDIGWRELPGSAQELATIASLFTQDEVTIFSGGEASKSALVRLEPPRVLHFATHAFFSTERFIVRFQGQSAIAGLSVGATDLVRSGLVLAGANSRRDLPYSASDDGILTALELSNLDLDGTQLVVINACQSGAGVLAPGSAVHGLQRAAHTAGAESVVSCLWTVDDNDARLLMSEFYAALARGTEPLAALSVAQNFILRMRRHPAHWAAWQITCRI